MLWIKLHRKTKSNKKRKLSKKRICLWLRHVCVGNVCEMSKIAMPPTRVAIIHTSWIFCSVCVLESVCLPNAHNGRKKVCNFSTGMVKKNTHSVISIPSCTLRAVGEVVFMLIKQSREQIRMAFSFILLSFPSIEANTNANVLPMSALLFFREI